MPISESQLSTWSNIGASDSSQRTYEAVRRALANYPWWGDMTYDVYLQGSYRNSTNIRGDSDVDVVVELTSMFRHNADTLPHDQQQRFHNYFSTSTQTLAGFKDSVIHALCQGFGTDRVVQSRKCIKVQTPYLPADVVVCASYREYDQFYGANSDSFVAGITFYIENDGRWVVNFPKLHYMNGVDKNASALDRFKPTVRCFKNARRYLVERSMLDERVAPSYFVECLLYNAPSTLFLPSSRDTFVGILEWMRQSQAHTYDGFVCQNRQRYLFGPTPEQWSTQNADTLLWSLSRLWNEFGR